MKSKKLATATIGVIFAVTPLHGLGADGNHSLADRTGSPHYAAPSDPVLTNVSKGMDIDSLNLLEIPGYIREKLIDHPNATSRLSESDVQEASFLQDYNKKLLQLASTIEKLTKVYSAEEEQKLRESYNWLVDRDQAPKCLEAVRRSFSQPNVILKVSEGLLKKIIGNNKITEKVDDYSTSGKARVHTTGLATIGIVPEVLADPNGAKIVAHLEGGVKVKLNGTIRNSQFGLNGYVFVNGSLPLTITDKSVTAGQPRVNTSSTTSEDYVTNDRFLGHFLRIGLVEAGLNKKSFETNAQLASKVKSRMVSKIQGQLDKFLPSPDQITQTLAENPLRQLSEDSSEKVFSTAHEIGVAGSYTSGKRLMSPFAPNAPRFPAADALVQVHESVINNNLGILGGVAIAQSEFQDALNGKLPKEKSGVLDKLEPSMMLDMDNPVHVSFRDGKVMIELKTSSFTTSTDAFDSKGAYARAVYHFQTGSNGLDVVREGELEINKGQADEATLTALREVMSGFLRSQMHFNAIPIKGGKAGLVGVSDLKVGDGWAYIGIQYQPNPQGSLLP